ncbi:copper resistance D family protein [Paenibacillus foliorum]|nr:CopD family protein [Paenibacillus foliorum]
MLRWLRLTLFLLVLLFSLPFLGHAHANLERSNSLSNATLTEESVKPKLNEAKIKVEASQSPPPLFGGAAAVTTDPKEQTTRTFSNERDPILAAPGMETKDNQEPLQQQVNPRSGLSMQEAEYVKPGKIEEALVQPNSNVQQVQPVEGTTSNIVSSKSETGNAVPSAEVNLQAQLQELQDHMDHSAHHYAGDSRNSVNYLLRIIEILAAASIAGFLFFRHVIWVDHVKAVPLLFSRQCECWLYLAAFMIYIVTGAAHIGLLSDQLSGIGSRNAAELSITIAGSTIVGNIAWLRPLLIGMLIILASFPETHKKPTITAKWIITIGLIVSFPLTGHALADSSAVVTAVSLHLIHLLGSALWFGGLIGIYSETWRPEYSIRYGGELNRLIRRFSTVMLPVILIVLISGTVLSIMMISSWEELYQIDYGRFLLAKTTLLMLIIGIGAFHRKILIPRMKAYIEHHQENAMKSMSRFVFFIQIEIAASLILFVLAGLLSTTPPPDKKAINPPIYWHVMGDKAHMSMRVSTDKHPTAAFKLDIWLPTGIGAPSQVNVFLLSKEDKQRRLEVPFQFVAGGPDPYGYEGFDKYIYEAKLTMDTELKDWVMDISITDTTGEVHIYNKSLTVQ